MKVFAAAAALAAAAGALAAGGCTGVATNIGGKPGPEAGLLRGKSPSTSAGVTHVARLTDGIAAAPDDPPRTELTSLFGSPGAFVIYDLGAEDAHRLRGDRRGGRRRLRPVGVDRRRDVRAAVDRARPAIPDAAARRARSPRQRAIPAPRGVGRRRRLRRRRAVGRRRVPAAVAARARAQHGTPIDNSVATKAWAFAALAAAYVLAYRRKLPDFFKLLVAAPLGVLIALVLQLADVWPPPRRCARRCSPRPRSSPPRSRSGSVSRRAFAGDQINQNVSPALRAEQRTADRRGREQPRARPARPRCRKRGDCATSNASGSARRPVVRLPA
jgi:hypothetical protein